MHRCDAEQRVADLDSGSAEDLPLQNYSLVQSFHCFVVVSFLHVNRTYAFQRFCNNSMMLAEVNFDNSDYLTVGVERLTVV